MNKTDIAHEIEMRFNLHPLEARKITDLFFDSMSEELSGTGRVEIRGFGNLTVRNYGSYTGRNPKTGESVKVQEKKMPFWKTGKDLFTRLGKK